MDFVLDSNVYIEIERNNDKIINELSKLNLLGKVSITSPTYSEIYDGLLKGRKDELKNKLESLNEVTLLNTTKNSSKLFAEIKHSLEKSGKMIPLFDILIASIVIGNDMTLLTMDEHFNKVPGLRKVILGP